MWAALVVAASRAARNGVHASDWPISLALLTRSPLPNYTAWTANTAETLSAGGIGAGNAWALVSRPPSDRRLGPAWSAARCGLTTSAAVSAPRSAGGAPNGESGPKKKRRSDTKLYSCRNSSARAQFDQIWPTLQMTEEEAQLFRRSSRVFVTDLGRSIPTRVKYSLAKDHPGQKVHYQEARSLIYESDLHLDAVGEHPRYLKLRRLRAGNYAAKLQAVRKLRLLMGFVRRGTLQRLYEQSLLQPGPDRVWKLVCAMEATLPAAALRSGLAHDVLASRVMGERGVFYVNGVRPLQPRAMFVQPGDVIGPGPWAADWHRRYVASQLGRRLLAAAEASWAGGDGSDAAVPEAPAGRDSRSVPTAF